MDIQSLALSCRVVRAPVLAYPNLACIMQPAANLMQEPAFQSVHASLATQANAVIAVLTIIGAMQPYWAASVAAVNAMETLI